MTNAEKFEEVFGFKANTNLCYMPEELKVMQGFPKDYIIDRDYRWKRYPVGEQVKRIGNSFVPITAQKLVSENCGYLKEGERCPNPIMFTQPNGQVAFG